MSNPTQETVERTEKEEREEKLDIEHETPGNDETIIKPELTRQPDVIEITLSANATPLARIYRMYPKKGYKL